MANDYTEALAAAFDAVIDHVSEFVPDQIPVFAGDTAQYHREFFVIYMKGAGIGCCFSESELGVW